VLPTTKGGGVIVSSSPRSKARMERDLCTARSRRREGEMLKRAAAYGSIGTSKPNFDAPIHATTASSAVSQKSALSFFHYVNLVAS